MMKKKGEITLDDLAVMVAGGFNEMQEQMDKRFDGVDKRFAEIDKRFAEIDKRFAEIDYQFNKIRAELNSLRVSLDRAVENIEQRLVSIEKMTKDDISCIGEEIFEVKKRIEKLEKNYLELKSAH